MSIEEVAERADVWSEAIKKIIKSFSAVAIAIGTAIGALIMWWPFGGAPVEEVPPLLQGTGYSPQCSQLFNTIDHNWTEDQWTVWEILRRDLGC